MSAPASCGGVTPRRRPGASWSGSPGWETEREDPDWAAILQSWAEEEALGWAWIVSFVAHLGLTKRHCMTQWASGVHFICFEGHRCVLFLLLRGIQTYYRFLQQS
jgi:hypothetical protein